MRRQEPSGARRDLGREGLAFLKGFLGGPPAGWTLERSSFTLQSLRFSLVNGPRRLELSGSPQLRQAAGAGWARLRSLHQDLSEPERALVDALAPPRPRRAFRSSSPGWAKTPCSIATRTATAWPRGWISTGITTTRMLFGSSSIPSGAVSRRR